ncbi:MAG: energy transducer TonB, partial [Sphingomonas sp.]|uniref:energy transducer TonB n=1 Tax=Sphingomonas sp. TaxID=28214 RepID=UPI0025CCE0A8
GTGAGGAGRGRGGGGEGGDGDGEDTPPRLLRGRLRYGDLPDWLRDQERTVRMELRYTIEVDGRVSRCGADQSSGYPEVDALICRLIRERYRYRPALDEDGDPVRSTMIERQDFIARPGKEEGD